MEDRGLRDIERWRDKIEVRLDNRQVFFLFFGSALVACMLFVLGVIVGKRLESRGRAVSPEIEDPLALLDKVATSPRGAQGAVSFPQALSGTSSKTGTDKHLKKIALVAESESDADKPTAAAKAEAKSATVAKPTEGTTKPTATEKSTKTETKSVAMVEDKKAETGAAKAKLTENKASEAKPAAPKEEKPAAIPAIAAGGDAKSKGHFTLQLSSFQDKAEAEAFAQKFAGEKPYLVVSEIPGKGTWYRVRVGDYATSQAAVAAKESFEKKHSVIAYVAQR